MNNYRVKPLTDDDDGEYAVLKKISEGCVETVFTGDHMACIKKVQELMCEDIRAYFDEDEEEVEDDAEDGE